MVYSIHLSGYLLVLSQHSCEIMRKPRREEVKKIATNEGGTESKKKRNEKNKKDKERKKWAENLQREYEGRRR